MKKENSNPFMLIEPMISALSAIHAKDELAPCVLLSDISKDSPDKFYGAIHRYPCGIKARILLASAKGNSLEEVILKLAETLVNRYIAIEPLVKKFRSEFSNKKGNKNDSRGRVPNSTRKNRSRKIAS